jgi:hypothetical protein
MKKIEKDELYEHLSGFFKRKGVVLAEGSYSQTIQKSCALLTDVLNCSQETLKRVKGEIDKRLDKVRQVIHQKSSPKPPPTQSAPPPRQAAAAPASEAKQARPKRKAPAKKAPTRQRPKSAGE